MYHAQAQWLSTSIRHSHSQSSDSVFVSVITFACEVFVYFAHFYTVLYNAIFRRCWVTYFFKVCSNYPISSTHFYSFSLVFQWSVSTSILNPIFLFCLLEVISVLFNLIFVHILNILNCKYWYKSFISLTIFLRPFQR